MKEYKLKLIDGEVYLLLTDMNKQAKDLPVGTIVLCIDEIPHEGACIRLSTKSDNCYGCQPLMASTKDVPGLEKLVITNYDKTTIQEFCYSPDRFRDRYETLRKQLIKSIEDALIFEKATSASFPAIIYNVVDEQGENECLVGVDIDKKVFLVSFYMDEREVNYDDVTTEQLLTITDYLYKKEYKDKVEWNTNY